jgi:hypothetical protein
LFAGKCHALLCRKYVKGRDWFDFVWYISQKVPINLLLLKNALFQTGPWEGQSISMDKDWILNAMSNKINEIDWDKAKSDVIAFLRPRDAQSVQQWTKDFFMHYLQKTNIDF